MTATEPIAWRHSKRGKAHRQSDMHYGVHSHCAGFLLEARGYEPIPLSQVPVEDRCRICWKDTP
jgi:hypothetical protein